MSGTISYGRMAAVGVTVENGAITDPFRTAVWHMEQQEDGSFTLYNEAAGVYCMISHDSTGGFSVGETAEYGFTVEENDADMHTFYMWTTLEGCSRGISIYQTDFRPYGAADYKELYLYKLAEEGVHTVTFLDMDGETVIGTQTVVHGESMQAPEPPVHEGYIFIGWDTDLSSVTEDLIVTALYEEAPAPGLIGDVDCSGEVTAVDALIVLRIAIGAGTEGISPQGLLNADVDGSGSIDALDALMILRMAMNRAEEEKTA